ncbi:CRISPR/Cas system CSM-associated protein Csm3, group 7 of RAMP superfamily [Caldanaerovirga acetigignens]|uniref:CRISPR/Cas system CSM-associated protein Csm3, group 7 of RAMP superfamily n=1 Tax=Caldanaerovirga acetigignens TaxID=447595 RepID=A0A1M7MMQ7_9FIRM|nr:RAMP superfamily CRISPR-associated protein [Caldanaerovirga acetigignens]SHM92225.1 CRISPR/Cas system CSM-associated protein Csm3, group 7 of RAMP superfamily [Caldanaerovirga acetigignens]
MKMYIHITLKSDATFGRGEGVAGLVDEEVEHDPKTGLPYLRGRTLKGLLVEQCANILYALEKQNSKALARLQQAASFLFGRPGSTLDDARMHVGPALLPEELCQAVEAHIKRGELTPAEVLESLTAIRRQTAVAEETGAPEEGSLRSIRVVLRETTFIASLDFDKEPDEDAKALLASCVLCLRRAGNGRNRGRGRLKARLLDENKNDITEACLQHFRQLVRGEGL